VDEAQERPSALDDAQAAAVLAIARAEVERVVDALLTLIAGDGLAGDPRAEAARELLIRRKGWDVAADAETITAVEDTPLDRLRRRARYPRK
jgi:hypothetical protein